MGSFSKKTRENDINILKNNHYDLLIIGGGITGCGIALDAVTRGMKVILVEMDDFASGTSSRSTKLIHGGLRYLKQFQINIVAETGKEREIVYENGPHVTSPEWMMLPFYKGGTFGFYSTSIGLRLYDFLAGVKKRERRKMFDKETTLKREPLLKQEGLKGSGYYVEYRTDDARLTIEVVKEAVARGAQVFSYMKVQSFIYKDGKVVGVEVLDRLSNKNYNLYAKKLVNATGPWVDQLREKDHSKKGKVIQLSKGVHLVFDQSRFPLHQSIYFDTKDGRMVFAIPRDGKTYVGTTDTFYENKKIKPRMTEADRDYIIEAINNIFPTVNIKVEDVESSWAGVRPLIYEEGKNASEISRKDEIWESHTGLITIAGGKLTGYRHMAETVVNIVSKQLTNEYNKTYKMCCTKKLPISGGDVGGSVGFEQYISKKKAEGIALGLEAPIAEKLIRLYGSNIDKIYAYVNEYKIEENDLPVHIFAPLMYALEYEMTITPVDLFMRRTGTSLFNISFVKEWKEKILNVMAAYLEWTIEEKEGYDKRLETHLDECVNPWTEG